MKKKVVSILQYLFFLALGIFLLWWSIRKIKDWGEIKASLSNANYWLIIPVIISLLLSHYSRAIRWRILIEPLGYHPKQSNAYLAVLVGYMANLAIPRLGEILKCTFLARYEKVPADKLIGTIVAERAFDVLCLLIVILITFFWQFDAIGGLLKETIATILQSKAEQLTTTKIVIFVVLLLAILGLIWFVLDRYAHLKFIKRIKVIIKGVWEGLISVKRIKNKGWFFFHSAFIWAMYLTSVRLGMYALQETSNLGWGESLAVLTTGSLAMIVPTPGGGLGVYHVFVQQTLLLYGLTEATGFAFGIILWVVQFFQMLLSGFVALLLFPYFNKSPEYAKT